MSHVRHDTCITIIVHACIMIIVRACIMTIVHISRPTGLMFREIKGGGLRGEAPAESRGLWGAASSNGGPQQKEIRSVLCSCLTTPYNHVLML